MIQEKKLSFIENSPITRTWSCSRCRDLTVFLKMPSSFIIKFRHLSPSSSVMFHRQVPSSFTVKFRHLSPSSSVIFHHQVPSSFTVKFRHLSSSNSVIFHHQIPSSFIIKFRHFSPSSLPKLLNMSQPYMNIYMGKFKSISFSFSLISIVFNFHILFCFRH